MTAMKPVWGSEALRAPRRAKRLVGGIKRIMGEIRGTCDGFLWLANQLPCALPCALGGRVRPFLLRLGGINVGAETILRGAIRFNSVRCLREQVHFGRQCFVNVEVFIDASAKVTIGDSVYLGHHVKIITATHEMGPPEMRAGQVSALPVTIGNGAWVAAGATLLPGVSIGAGAVVAAGAVVTREVPANTLVGGVPAKILRTL